MPYLCVYLYQESDVHTVTASQNGTVMGSGQQTIVVYSNPNLTLTTNTGNTEICEGDTITIYATVDPVTDLLVGDILCDDGTFVHAAEWEPNNGKTAKGIVFYVDLTGVHGWAVGLEQTSAKWFVGTPPVIVPGLQVFSHWMDAISDLDGYANTRAIRNKGNASEYPAAWAVDFANGWYLPAIGQLNVLLGSLFVVNNSLEKVGGTLISYATNSQYIWSSSASTLPGYSIAFLPIYEQVEFKPKSSSFFVRGVINF